MKQRIFSSLLTISLVLLTKNLSAAEISAAAPRTGLGLDLITSVGSQLDKQDNKASIGFEPTVSYDFGERRRLELYSAIDRPFNQYENVTVPKTILTYGQGFDLFSKTSTTATAALTALSLDRWKTDGRMVRGSVALTNSKEILSGLTLAFKIGPYAQLNEYRQNAAGRDLPKFGLTEKITLEYVNGPLVLDVVVLFDQKYGVVWKNAYSTLEQAAFRIDDQWMVGVAHELLGSAVDDSTGLFRPMQVFNERNSRVSAFVEYQL
jgi:hypothetical protein